MQFEIALQEENKEQVSDFVSIYIDPKTKLSNPISLTCNKSCKLKGSFKIKNSEGKISSVTSDNIEKELNVYCVKNRVVDWYNRKRSDKKIDWTTYLEEISLTAEKY